MFKIFKPLLTVLFLVSILLLPYFTLAEENPTDRLVDVGDHSGYETAPKKTDLPVIVGEVISVVLTLLGMIFLALIIYAGVLWMIAAGHEDKVTRSKDTMRRAVIGLMIVVAAFVISKFVIGAILK